MVKISIISDICPTHDWQDLFDSGTAETLAVGLKGLVSASDYCVANLECPITNSVTKIRKSGPNQKGKESDLGVLKDIGVNAFSLANNHIKDYGSCGVLDTIEYLKKHQFDWFGAGNDINHMKNSLNVRLKDKSITFISFAEEEFNLANQKEAGANGFDPYCSGQLIQRLKSEADYVIVLYHGGIEHYAYPSPELMKKCRFMVDLGADCVICQHSHCIGTYEYYKNGYILYGQGNGIFGYRRKSETWNEGLLLNIIINDSITIEYNMMYATSRGIKVCDDKKRLSKFHKESEKIASYEFLISEWSKFCKSKEALDLPQLYGWNKNLVRLNRILCGSLCRILVSERSRMTSMNYIRCDALREVLKTCLQDEFQ